jgi:hypothetical protein
VPLFPKSAEHITNLPLADKLLIPDPGPGKGSEVRLGGERRAGARLALGGDATEAADAELAAETRCRHT